LYNSKQQKMKNVLLSIPDMQSAHCQSRVSAAINNIGGFKIEEIAAGKLAATVENDEVKEQVIAAIEKAGYKTSEEDNKTAADCSTGCCSS
jgi:copper chaperone